MHDKPLAVRPRRGRPVGSASRVVRDDVAPGLQHFAFLRSWAQGLDLRSAWQRYLGAGRAAPSAQAVARQAGALQRQVLAQGQLLQGARPHDRQLADDLALLAAPLAAAPRPALPSLEAFAEALGLDDGFYSEAELLQEYRAHFGLDANAGARARATVAQGPSPTADSTRRVQALHRLEALLARAPQADDRVERWLCPTLSRGLVAAGLPTLGALVQAVEANSARWHARVPGVGPRRAAQVAEWLRGAARSGGPDGRRAWLGSTHRADPKGANPAGRGIDSGLGPGASVNPVPMPLECWTDAWADRDAVLAWLDPHREVPATHRAYRREAERFLLWCRLQRGVALAQVGASEVQAYLAFLSAPPADWVNPRPVARSHPDWRPLRGPLDAGSLRSAWAVVRALVNALRTTWHLSAAPLAKLQRTADHGDGSAPAGLSVPLARQRGGRRFTRDERAFLEAQLALDVGAAATLGRRAGGRHLSGWLRLQRLVADGGGVPELGWSPAGAGRAFKRYVRRLAARAAQVGLEPARFRAASLGWLRRGVDVTPAKRLLGDAPTSV